ncbi:hypothetical protein ACFPK9_10920 [Rubritalea spongiae]|uniref:Cell division inhibitor n=1 Tax=Rubritalea spongiae TaxID=430797 RepID=A0ABW5DY85_9BACT
MIYFLKRSQKLPCTLEDAWSFFSSPRNLEKLTPASINFEINHCSSETMFPHQLISYKIGIAPFVKVNWLTEITHISKHPSEGYSFIDEQRIGPYKLWHHHHKFVATENGVNMIDEVAYALPFGILGTIAHKIWVKKQLEHIFNERAKLSAKIFNA